MSPKTIEQLVDTTEPGMAQVRQWIGGAKNTVELLDVDPAAGRRTLLDVKQIGRAHV